MNELNRGIEAWEVVELEDADEAYLLGAWVHEARQLREQLPLTSDSVEILGEISQERAREPV